MKTEAKRLVSLICTVLMLVVFTVPTMADNKSLAFDMESMGITTGIDADKRGEEYVRRDEFAQMVVNMMLQQDVAKTLKNEAYFTDISDSKYKGAINLLVQMGYISGSGNGMYNPSDYITYGAACKILVHALGYNVITTDKTLNGYQFVAGNIKLTNGVDFSKPYLTFNQAMIMIDNALDIGLMVPMYYNDNITPSYEIDEDRTFRSYLNGRTGTGIVKMRGIVTADISTFLYAPVKNLKPNQLQIEGKTYTLNTTSPKGLVGQEVDFYITQKDYEEGNINAITPTVKNVVCDFSGPQIDKISSDSIEFYVADGKIKVVTNSATRYIVNNRLDLKFNLAKDLVADESVVIRTVDNNDDEIADVVYIFDYTDCIVESVSTETNTITFEDGFMFGSTKSIKLDEEKIYWEVHKADGSNIAVEDLKAGDVVSVAMSTDKEYVRFVKGLAPVEGVIVSRDGEYITLDDVEYTLGDAVINDDIKLGIKVVGYLNFLGTLVDYEEEKLEHTYGYIYSYSSNTGISGGCKVKMFLPEYISVKQVEGEVDELSGAVATSNSLFVRNKSVVIYPTESKISFNGVKMKAETVLAQVVDKPVSYKFNENGNIYKIDTLDAVDEIDIKASENKSDCVQLNKKMYNGTENLFGGGKGSPFGIQENHTLAFCVPLYAEQSKSNVSDEDLAVFVELSNGLEYESNGYEMDETNEVVDVLVIQRIMNSDMAIPVIDNSDVGLVLSVSDVLENDMEYKAITMLTDGKEQKFIVSDSRVDQSVFGKIAKNDLIAYTLDGFDHINSVLILQKNDEYYESFTDGYSYGEVKNIEYNKVSNSRVRRVNRVEIGYSGVNGTETTAELLVRNPAPVYIIEGKTAKIGSLNDIQVGDMVYMSIYNLVDVRAVIVKR